MELVETALECLVFSKATGSVHDFYKKAVGSICLSPLSNRTKI